MLTYDADHILRPVVGHRDAQRHLIEAHLPALRHDAHVTAAAQQQTWLQQLLFNAGVKAYLGPRCVTAPLTFNVAELQIGDTPWGITASSYTPLMCCHTQITMYMYI